ncbi:MAG TPA: methyltransferase [Bryobacteraceae bacterium]|nr:methyltransferase [Bryobacteraceae bacterium]
MQPFRLHVFICNHQKPEGVPCCAARGSAPILESLRREIAAQGLDDQVQVTECGSLGLCEQGPNLVVYPEGAWYSGVTPADVPEIVRAHFQEGHPVERLLRTDPAAVRAEIHANREKMIAARRAREAAGVLPDDLQDRIRGFQQSRAILTALELDLFTAIGAGAASEAVAARLGAAPRSTGMLLNALASLHLLVKREGVYYNSPAPARYFTAGSPDNARPALLHTAHLWHRWSTLTDCVRSGSAVAREEPGGRLQDWTEAFIAAMHRNASERAPLVVRAVGAAGITRMLDVGGGSGAYSIAFAQANSALRAEILDQPAVISIAQRHIREAGVADRVTVRTGDLRSDKLGEGYGLVFLSAICHMLSPAENLDLFGRCREALASGGRIVIQDFILEPDKTAPRFAALFALNMLVGTAGGSSYSQPEYAAWLRDAGFEDVGHVPLPGITGLMMASRP